MTTKETEQAEAAPDPEVQDQDGVESPDPEQNDDTVEEIADEEETPESVETLETAFEDFDKLSVLLDAPKKPKPEKVEDDAEETEEEDPEAAEQAATEIAPEAAPEAKGKSFRIRTKDEKLANLVRLVTSNPDANFADLAEKAGYTVKDAKAAIATVETKPEAVAEVEEVDPLPALRTKIETLKAQRKQLREDFDPKADEVSDEIEAARDELRNAEFDQKQAKATFTQTFATHNQKAAQLHPKLAEAGSPQAVFAKGFLATKPPAFFKDPSWPIKAVQEMEAAVPSLFPKAGVVQQQKKPVVKTQPKVAARPLGAAVSATTSGKNPPTRADVLKAIDSAESVEELEALGRLPNRL